MNWTGERGGYSRWGKQEINSTSPHSKTVTQPLNFSCCSDHGAFCAFRSQQAWHGALGQRWSCSAGQAETVPAVTSYFLHLKHNLSFPVLQGKYPSQNHGLDSAIQAQHLHTLLVTDFLPIHWSSVPPLTPPLPQPSLLLLLHKPSSSPSVCSSIPYSSLFPLFLAPWEAVTLTVLFISF